MNQLLRTEAKLAIREPIGMAFGLLLPLVLVLAFGLSADVRSPIPTSTARSRSTPRFPASRSA